MNRIVVVILLICSSLFVNAQEQYANTQTGRKVLLKTDGTWEYVNSTNKNNSQINALRSSPQNSNNTRTVNRVSSSSNNNRSVKAKSRVQYIRGSRGGCYYINSNGNKTYVDRSLCD